MNRLQLEWRRLYFAQDAEDASLIDATGQVRAMVLELARPADWWRLSTVWQAVQADLDWPAPAIAVSGIDGHQLWFSLAAPVPVAQARGFLDALRGRYLGDMKPERIGMWPAFDASAPPQVLHARPVPTLQDTGYWSAFVVPGLAPMFADEPWLDIAPSPDAQADLLSRFKSVPAADFQRALELLQPAAMPAPRLADTATDVVTDMASGGAGLDPKRFLLAVMNDPAVALHLRIEAAKALLSVST